VSNIFRARATERECSSGEGHIVNCSLGWGPQLGVTDFIPNFYESLLNDVIIVTAGFVACI